MFVEVLPPSILRQVAFSLARNSNLWLFPDLVDYIIISGTFFNTQIERGLSSLLFTIVPYLVTGMV